MIIGYLLVALSGLFFFNGLPHVTRGSAGYRHRVPWAVPASAGQNILWGAANWVAGIWIAWWGSTFDLFPPLAVTVAVVVGAVALVPIASRWEKEPASRGQQPD